jgi:hypothetical protein
MSSLFPGAFILIKEDTALEFYRMLNNREIDMQEGRERERMSRGSVLSLGENEAKLVLCYKVKITSFYSRFFIV